MCPCHSSLRYWVIKRPNRQKFISRLTSNSCVNARYPYRLSNLRIIWEVCMVNRRVFKSVFAQDINEYLDEKIRSGYCEKSYYYHLKCFDRFCCDNALCTKEFNQTLADEWVKIRPTEASTTHYSNQPTSNLISIQQMKLVGISMPSMVLIQFKTKERKSSTPCYSVCSTAVEPGLMKRWG